MENQIKIYEGKVIELKLNNQTFLAIDMPRKPEQAHISFPLQGAFGLLTVEAIFSPYLEKDIRITIEEKQGKVHNIKIEELKKTI